MNYFDVHADTPIVLDSNNHKSSVVDVVNHPFEKYNQVMAVFLRDSDDNPFESYNRRLALINSDLSGKNFPFIKKNISSAGAILSVENAGFLAEDINRIYKLFFICPSAHSS